MNKVLIIVLLAILTITLGIVGGKMANDFIYNNEHNNQSVNSLIDKTKGD